MTGEKWLEDFCEMMVIAGGGEGRGRKSERRDGFTCFNEGHVSVRMLQTRLNFVNSAKRAALARSLAISGQDLIF